MTTAREQAREALASQPAHRRAANAEACADVVSDVWEAREARLRTAFETLGYKTAFDKIASGEMNPNRCESIVHHGPGHQSTSRCAAFVHDDEWHYNNELGYSLEWTNERPYA